MRRWSHLPVLALLAGIALNACMLTHDAHAQLSSTFDNLFRSFLEDQLVRLNPDGSVNIHGEHYVPASLQAANEITPALNGLIASNISSFPLSSTIAGMSIDISNGRAVLTSESLGPIFAETAETIGRGKINIALGYSYVNYQRLRGLPIDQIRFTFAHQDVTPTPPFDEDTSEDGSLGNPAYELDNIDIFPNMQVSSGIFAFTLTAGVLQNLDISLFVPVVNVSLSGNAHAVINSFTYGRLIPARPEFEGAAHRFGGTLLDPILEAESAYSSTTNGIGDIAVRLKYKLPTPQAINAALLADIRLPTGDSTNFLGTGHMNARIIGIFSKRMGDFNPHLNVGFDRRMASFDSDEFEFALGFDQKLSNIFTVAADLLGAIDLQKDETIQIFPGSVSIPESFQNGSVIRTFNLTNIPQRSTDSTLDLAFGFRVAPSDRIVMMGNILVPLNDSGLRADFIPTFGLSIAI
ncbi:MAG: hypothetical protein R2834_02055 [Rhodothermales bacterium]